MARTFLLAIAIAASTVSARAQIISAPFDADYSFTDLGAVPGLPAPAGGLTFLPGNPNVILIGGAANSSNADVFSIGVVRDANDHVTGFTGMAAFYADAPGIGFGGIDGGLAFGPSGILFYTSYSDNSLGQIKPGSTAPDRQDALTPLGVNGSVGTLAFVPPGFAGAGKFKLVQYAGSGSWYEVTLGALAANGTYPISAVTLKKTIGGGPEGVIYVSSANPQFAKDSVLVSEYSLGSVAAYEIDANGDPEPATRRVFMTNLSGAEGAVIDPLTGDFLFSTFGGGNRVIVVQGFVAPTTTTTTTVATTTSMVTTTAVPTTSTSVTSTSTSVPTTSTSSSSSSTLSSSSTSTSSTSTSSTSTTSSTATPVPSTTTSTTIPSDDCALVPVGPTFRSIGCRLEDLLEATADAGELERLQEKVLVSLGKAKSRTDEARERCAGGDTKKSRTRLKQAIRQLIQYSHRLRGQSARKNVPSDVREPLAQAADAIGGDVKTLRSGLQCPAAAGASGPTAALQALLAPSLAPTA